MLIVVAIGHLRYQQQIYTYQHFHSVYQNIACNIRAKIINKEIIEYPIITHCVTLQTESIQIPNNEWQNTKNKLFVYTQKKCTALVGDSIQLYNVRIKQPKSSSFKDYLIKEGIMGTLFCNPFSYNIIEHPNYSFDRWLFQCKKKLYRTIQQKLSLKTFTLFSSLFLGNKATNKKEVEHFSDTFKRWGIAHYLARSGLHLVIFIMVWNSILRLIPIYFTIKQIISVLLSIIYLLLSWPTTSFNRAFYAFLIYKLCILFHRRSNFLHIMTLITLFILFFNPIQLFFLDFQLSFALTFAIAWLNQITHARTAVEK